MRWKWDNVYSLQGLPNIYSSSVCAPPLPLYHCTPAIACWGCTLRPGSSEYEYERGDRNWVNSEMHLQAVMEIVWICTWRLGSIELRDTLRCGNRATLEMCLEAKILLTQRFTWRPWSIQREGLLGVGSCGGDWSDGYESEGSPSGASKSGGGRLGGLCDGSWYSIHWLSRNYGNVENCVQQGLLRTERLAWCGSQAVLGWCSMQCM